MRRSAATPECRGGSKTRSPRHSHTEIPGRQRGGAKQHRESVMVDIAGLQAHRTAGDVEDARRDAVRSEAVDDHAVTALPKQTADCESRTNEEEVVEFVEVPFVEQEPIKSGKLRRQPLWR